MFGITTDGTYLAENIGFSTPELTSGFIVAQCSVQHEWEILPGDIFGRWTDEDGTVYWDVVEVIPNILTALQTAYLRSEIAIWDIAENKELRVADWYPVNP